MDPQDIMDMVMDPQDIMEMDPQDIMDMVILMALCTPPRAAKEARDTDLEATSARDLRDLKVASQARAPSDIMADTTDMVQHTTADTLHITATMDQAQVIPDTT